MTCSTCFSHDFRVRKRYVLRKYMSVLQVLETVLRDADWLATCQAVVQQNSKVDKNFSVQNNLLLWKNR